MMTENFSFAEEMRTLSADLDEIEAERAELRDRIDAMFSELRIYQMSARVSGYWETAIDYGRQIDPYIAYDKTLVNAQARMLTDLGSYFQAMTLTIEPLHTLH